MDTSSLYYDLTKSKPEAVRAFKKLLLNILLSAPWHDSEIVDIVIDRSRPGVTDSVVLTINWTEEDYCNKLLFEKVYYVSLDLNFGVVCGEQGEPIDYVVNEHEDNALISSIKEKWNHKLDDVPLEYFKIKTSSTNSSIVIGLSLLQGIFPTQGLNPGLPHCRQILNQLSHQGRGFSSVQFSHSVMSDSL